MARSTPTVVCLSTYRWTSLAISLASARQRPTLLASSGTVPILVFCHKDQVFAHPYGAPGALSSGAIRPRRRRILRRSKLSQWPRLSSAAQGLRERRARREFQEARTIALPAPRSGAAESRRDPRALRRPTPPSELARDRKQPSAPERLRRPSANACSGSWGCG